MNDHFFKWIIKSIFGLSFIAAGIIFIYYSLTQMETETRWLLYAIVAAVSISTGVFLTCSAFIHKLKSELRHRQKGHGKSDLID